MLRVKVGDIAKLAGCSPYFIRRFADGGHIKSVRDINDWRIFPEPGQAVKIIQRLLGSVDEATETSGTTGLESKRCD